MRRSLTSLTALSWEKITAALLAAALAVCCVLASDIRLTYQVALYVGVVGAIVIAIVPQQRLMLVLLWILLHPLSLEKVLPFGTSWHVDFPQPAVVFSASDAALFLLIGRIVLEALVLRQKPVAWPAVATPYCLLCAWAVLVFLTAPTTSGALQLTHWWKTLVFLLVLPAAIRTRAELYLVLAALALAVGVQSLVVWLSWKLHRPIGFITLFSSASPPMMSFTGIDGSARIRASGTFGQVNQQALLHVFYTLPLLGLAFVRNTGCRLLATATIALSLSAVLVTFSRTAWIAGAVASGSILLAAIVFGKMTRRTWLLVGTVSALGLALVGAFFQPVMDRLLRGDEGASSSRLRLVSAALRLATVHPIMGGGPGNFVQDALAGRDIDRHNSIWLPPGARRSSASVDGFESYESYANGRFTYVPVPVHNKYLLVLVELGLVGLFLFLWFQWRLLRVAWDCLRTRDPTLLWTALGLSGALAATQVYFMLDLAYDDKTVLVMLLGNALLVSLAGIVRAEQREEVAA